MARHTSSTFKELQRILRHHDKLLDESEFMLREMQRDIDAWKLDIKACEYFGARIRRANVRKRSHEQAFGRAGFSTYDVL
jgi:hypothetical protein